MVGGDGGWLVVVVLEITGIWLVDNGWWTGCDIDAADGGWCWLVMVSVGLTVVNVGEWAVVVGASAGLPLERDG